MGPPSPSKGKGVDTGSRTWRVGWWDFYPLLEHPKRPLQWTQSSVIFSGHPTQALITGRHFSSSKQFILPSPASIITSPAPYDPPSVLSVSPSDQWLFAYFPRRDGEGIGCLWKRGDQIDCWFVKECWNYPKGGGVVAASWLGNHREWAASAGIPTRLPPRGPPTPVSDPTLVLVTEDNYVHITYSRFYATGIRSMKRNLSFNGIVSEAAANLDIGENPNPARQCQAAAIGIGYNETSIFIATHSRRMPPPLRSTVTAPAFNSMGISVPDQKSIQWENYAEERIIELFEVQLRFDGVYMAIMLTSLPSLEFSGLLTDLAFLCTPPAPRTSQPSSNAAPSPPKRTPPEKGNMYLAISSIEFHDYIQPPTSSLSLYSFIFRSTPGNLRANYWDVHNEGTRVFETGVLTHIEPFINLSEPSTTSLYTTIVHHSGALPGPPVSTFSRSKEAPIGTINVLNIPDLSDQTSWEPTSIANPVNSLGRDLPLIAAVSPNRRLICMLSSSLAQSQTTIHALPKPPASDTSNHRERLSLAIAILGRVSATDLIHPLCSPKLPLSQATDTICHTLEILDRQHGSPMPYPSTWDLVGVAVDVYRARSLLSNDEKESETLKDRWRTGHDICSLAACNIAFEVCKEDAGYDLDAAWEIISMCTWIVNFTEKLMKACVLWSSALIDMKSDASIAPILLHLAHPFTLQNLLVALKHVQAFRAFIGSLPAGSENSKIAQVVLIDAIDCSGIDFEGLISILGENLDSAKKLDASACRKALAACQPVAAMQAHLGQLLHKISQSETVLNKSTLFIKAFDLVDGVARLSVGNQRKNDEKDVVTKGTLLTYESRELCLRCGGKSAMNKHSSVASENVSPKWAVWEHMWQLRCICGGSWFSLVT